MASEKAQLILVIGPSLFYSLSLFGFLFLFFFSPSFKEPFLLVFFIYSLFYICAPQPPPPKKNSWLYVMGFTEHSHLTSTLDGEHGLLQTWWYWQASVSGVRSSIFCWRDVELCQLVSLLAFFFNLHPQYHFCLQCYISFYKKKQTKIIISSDGFYVINH